MLSHERRENHLQESAPTTRCAFAPARVETENKVADQATAGAAERHSGPAPSPKDMTINLKVQKQRHLPNVSCAHPNTPVAESQLDTSAPRHSERQALPTTPGDVFGDTLVPPGAGAAEAPGKSWEHSCPRGPLSANEPPSSGQHAGPPPRAPHSDSPPLPPPAFSPRPWTPRQQPPPEPPAACSRLRARTPLSRPDFHALDAPRGSGRPGRPRPATLPCTPVTTELEAQKGSGVRTLRAWSALQSASAGASRARGVGSGGTRRSRPLGRTAKAPGVAGNERPPTPAMSSLSRAGDEGPCHGAGTASLWLAAEPGTQRAPPNQPLLLQGCFPTAPGPSVPSSRSPRAAARRAAPANRAGRNPPDAARGAGRRGAQPARPGLIPGDPPQHGLGAPGVAAASRRHKLSSRLTGRGRVAQGARGGAGALPPPRPGSGPQDGGPGEPRCARRPGTVRSPDAAAGTAARAPLTSAAARAQSGPGRAASAPYLRPIRA